MEQSQIDSLRAKFFKETKILSPIVRVKDNVVCGDMYKNIDLKLIFQETSIAVKNQEMYFGVSNGTSACFEFKANEIEFVSESNVSRLKGLRAIKRDAQAILDDDTVNSWMTDKDATRKYTEAQVKQAAEDYNNAVKETDLIIEGL